MEQTITLKYYIIVSRDEYKEFEKLIQEDLQEVDDRLEEEEVRVINYHCQPSNLHEISLHYKL